MLKADYNESERLAHSDWNNAAATINSIESSTPDYLPKKVGDNLLEDSIFSDDGNGHVDGDLNVTGNITTGHAGDGTGGSIRFKNDGAVTKFLAGLLGTSAAKDFVVFDAVRGLIVFRINGDTGLADFSAPIIAGTPTDNNHLTTKQYVDEAIAALRTELTA